MNYEFPKALYKDGKWDGVSLPDCVDVVNQEEQDAQAERGYYPFGSVVEQEKRKPGRPRKTEAE